MKSITEKYKGLSFADVAKKIESKYPNRELDALQNNAFEQEMEHLFNLQESYKVKEGVKQKLARGGYTTYRDQVAPLTRTGSLVPDFGLPPLDMMQGDRVVTEEEGVPLNRSNILTQEMNPQSYRTVESVASFDKLSQRAVTPRSETDPIESMAFAGSTYDPETSSKKSFQERLAGIYNKVFKKSDGTTEEGATTDSSESSSNPYTKAFIGAGLNLGLNAGLLSRGSEVQLKNMNPYENKITGMLDSMNTDNTAVKNSILSRFNAQRDGINGVRSEPVRQALLANAGTNEGQTMANAEFTNTQEQNRLKGLKAQMFGQLGQADVQSSYMTDDINTRNRGAMTRELSNFGTAMAENLKGLTTLELNDKQNQRLAAILNQIHSDFGIDPDTMEIKIKQLEASMTPEQLADPKYTEAKLKMNQSYKDYYTAKQVAEKEAKEKAKG